MSLYQLPKLKFPKLGKRRQKNFEALILIIFISSIFGFLAGWSASQQKIIEKQIIEKQVEYLPQTSQEQKIIEVVKAVSPAVVSIIITKDVPIIEQFYISPFDDFFGQTFQIPQYRQKGTEKKEIGGGTGFIVSEDGMILTNKHVVLDEDADYTVFTTEGKSFSAKVLARDPAQDIALLKIDRENKLNETGDLISEPFPKVSLGDSDKLQIGQTVIAIGNALGEFRNTISVGVVSGLGRTITATGPGLVEILEDVIQTDAAINMGNSGGPLLNLRGQVIGINTAMVEEAQSIGFAISINKAKRDISQVEKFGKIVYPYLGVYYTIINEELQKNFELANDYGAWVGRNEYGKATEQAVIKGTAAEEIGLLRDDIILEFDEEKISFDNSLAKIIMKYEPGDDVKLKILRGDEEIIFLVTLGERSE